MKAPWLKRISFIFFILLLSFSSVAGAEKKISREQALEIAQATAEAKDLFQVQDGLLKDCVESKVLETCNSDWVTCIDDAWVVQFDVGEACPVRHDGRLSLTFLVDGITGDIISRYPEHPYFKNPHYCQADYECLDMSAAQTEGSTCLNFIYGQLYQTLFKSSPRCTCLQNQCVPAE